MEIEDVSGESSAPEVEESSTQDVEASSTSEAAPASQTSQDQYVPYTRFKEVINERNQDRETLKSLQERLEQFERSQSQPKPESPKDFTSRAREIDPEFGKWAEEQSSAAEIARQVQEQLQSFQAEQRRQQAMSEMDRLHGEYKTPDALKEAYKAELIAQAQANPKMSLKDLAPAYKAIHERYNSFLENYKKDAIAGYTKSKTAPTPPTGKGKTPGKSADSKSDVPEGYDAKEWNRHKIARDAVAKWKAQSDI